MNLPSKKAKLIDEMHLFLLIALFLAFLFCSFVTYRRMILGLPPVNIFSYGYASLQAIIFTKIIMLGKMLGLGQRFPHMCLAAIVLYKSLVFALFTLAFATVEETIHGLLAGHALKDITAVFMNGHSSQLGGRFMVSFAAFVPFFSFLELGQVVGEEKLFCIFFKIHK